MSVYYKWPSLQNNARSLYGRSQAGTNGRVASFSLRLETEAAWRPQSDMIADGSSVDRCSALNTGGGADPGSGDKTDVLDTPVAGGA